MERTLVIRIALGTVTVIAAGWIFFPKNVRPARLGGADGVDILVAAHYIPAFAPVRAGAVKIEETPKAFVPPGALHKVNELTNKEGQPNFMSAVAIPEGQPLTQTVLVDSEHGESLAGL